MSLSAVRSVEDSDTVGAVAVDEVAVAPTGGTAGSPARMSV
jgi:hypothetical protein